MVCDREQLANFAQSCTMFGVLIGNLVFSIMADRYAKCHYKSVKMKSIYTYIYGYKKRQIIKYNVNFVLELVGKSP